MKRSVSILFVFLFLFLCSAESHLSAKASWQESLVRDNVLLWQEEAIVFPDAKVFFAVIPEKEYYTSVEYRNLYSSLLSVVQENAPENAEEIPLTPMLSASDYYTDDRHWRQEAIYPIAKQIAETAGMEIEDRSVFRERHWEDTSYWVSPVLDAASVFFYGKEEKGFEAKEGSLYREVPDIGYSLFLSGAQALIRIENPLCKNGRALVLFRDSFASSLAPLLVGGYERIWLVDTRYFSHRLLASIPELIGEQKPDILFLYSAGALAGTVMR